MSYGYTVIEQVPGGSRVKLHGISQIVYQIVSAVMLWWSNYFRTGLSWCGKCNGLCWEEEGAYQAVLDSCWEPGTGNVGQGAGGEDLALLLGAKRLTRFCLPAL